MLTNPLRDRFGIVARLEFYSSEELAHRQAQRGLLNAPIDEEGCFEIARRSRGTPRIANRLLRRVRDYADVKGDGRITREIADKALAMLDVDPQGFDIMDRKLLEAVVHRFDGGPVGLDNIAASIGEESGTIEDVIEPYLIQQGFCSARRAGAWPRRPPTATWACRPRRRFGCISKATTQKSARLSEAAGGHRRGCPRQLRPGFPAAEARRVATARRRGAARRATGSGSFCGPALQNACSTPGSVSIRVTTWSSSSACTAVANSSASISVLCGGISCFSTARTG
jgi:hypothetical protein